MPAIQYLCYSLFLSCLHLVKMCFCHVCASQYISRLQLVEVDVYFHMWTSFSVQGECHIQINQSCHLLSHSWILQRLHETDANKATSKNVATVASFVGGRSVVKRRYKMGYKTLLVEQQHGQDVVLFIHVFHSQIKCLPDMM